MPKTPSAKKAPQSRSRKRPAPPIDHQEPDYLDQETFDRAIAFYWLHLKDAGG